MSLFYFLLFYCIVYSLTIIIVIIIPLSFGCRDEEISPFVGQIKEILILILILSQSLSLHCSLWKHKQGVFFSNYCNSGRYLIDWTTSDSDKSS